MKIKFYKAKVAFEIPEIFREETSRVYIGQIEIPDELVNLLMDLGDSEFVSNNLCNPDLVIYDLSDPAKEIKEMEAKINKVLKQWANRKNLTARNN